MPSQTQTKTIDLGFNPRPWQFRCLQALKRFAVIVVHRRGGKTRLAVAKLIDAALKLKLERGRFAYIAPELKQAKAVAWDYLKHYAGKIPSATINESELWVEAPNEGGSRSRIRIYGADNPDSLRGIYLDGAVLDEVAQMKSETWGEIILPTLSDRQGWAIFIGTPKGINLFSDLYFRAQSDPTWHSVLFDINDTQCIPPQELETLRRNMSDQEWRQEMLCDFGASSDEALISLDLVQGALGKHLREDAYNFAPKVLGVDVAQGGDRSVIQPRQGLAAFTPYIEHTTKSFDFADKVARKWSEWEADACFVDNSGGYGDAVCSRLVQLNFAPFPVDFGGASNVPGLQNKRVEMWVATRDWLMAGGVLPNMPEYRIDLTGPRKRFPPSGKLGLESKVEMLARGLASTDVGDALGLTHASPVYKQQVMPAYMRESAKFAQHEYDPWSRA